MFKNKSLVIFPLSLAALFSLAGAMLKMADQSLMMSLLKVEQIPFLKTSTTSTWLFLGFVMYIAANLTSFEKIFTRSIAFLSTMLGLAVAYLLLKDIVKVPFTTASTGFESLLNYKAYVLFHHLTLICHPGLLTLLLWGCMGQIFSRSSAYKLYFPLAVIIGIIYSMLPALLRYLPVYTVISNTAWIVGAITLLALSVVIFKRNYPKLASEMNEPDPKMSHMPVLSSAFLIRGIAIAMTMGSLLFRSNLKETLTTPQAYLTFMGQLTLIQGSVALVLSALIAYFGYKLLNRLGFQKLLYGAVWTSIALGAIYLLSIPKAQLIPLATSQSGMTIISTSVLFPMVQLFYLHLPKAVRFRKKVGIEMLVAPFLASCVSIMLQASTLVWGGLSHAKPFIMTFYILMFAILLLAARSTAIRYSKQVQALS